MRALTCHELLFFLITLAAVILIATASMVFALTDLDYSLCSPECLDFIYFR